VSGAGGPALALRSIFGELTRHEVTEGLKVPKVSDPVTSGNAEQREDRLQITFPTPGLQVAIDPRVPVTSQKMPLRIVGLKDGDIVKWLVDGLVVGTATKSEFFWQLKPGEHRLNAIVTHLDKRETRLADMTISVK
jgi:penicillin-binding protein 1C